ncbi:MAG: TIGR00341 family protein, partial [Cyanobacteria bacterium J06607_15]
MRQLTIQVPSGKGNSVLDTAKKYGGVNLLMFEAISDYAPRTSKGDRGRVDAVTVYLDNARVENFLNELESLPDVHINLIPRGVMALEPPPEEAPQQLTDVTERSPLEIFLAGLQSIGSWQGFISFAVAGGIVVWTGLFTNSAFLLVAALLIA